MYMYNKGILDPFKGRSTKFNVASKRNSLQRGAGEGSKGMFIIYNIAQNLFFSFRIGEGVGVWAFLKN